jgi:PAS domain S-box-containing protein
MGKAMSEIKPELFCGKVLETSPGIIYIYDLINNENIYVNPEAEEYLGYSQEELWDFKDKLYEKTIHPDDVEKVIKYNELLKTFVNGERIKVHFRVKNKKDNYRWFVGYESVFKRNENGDPIQKIGNIIDVTEQVNSTNELKAIISTSPFIYFILDNKGTYLKAYPEESEKHFEVYPEDYLNKTVDEVWGDRCPEIVDKFYTKLPEILRADYNTAFSITYTLINPKTDQTHLFEAIITKIDEERLLATVRDITETKNAVENNIGISALKFELQRLESSKDFFQDK